MSDSESKLGKYEIFRLWHFFVDQCNFFVIFYYFVYHTYHVIITSSTFLMKFRRNDIIAVGRGSETLLKLRNWRLKMPARGRGWKSGKLWALFWNTPDFLLCLFIFFCYCHFSNCFIQSVFCIWNHLIKNHCEDL